MDVARNGHEPRQRLSFVQSINMLKVLFLDEVHSVLSERLATNGFTCIDATKTPIADLPSMLSDAVGIVIRSRIPVNEELLRYAPNLQFVARSGAGMENIDEDYTSSRNITCFNAPEGNRNAVAEHALGMLLSLFNQLNKGDREVRNLKWDREGNRGVELDGKTIGIIGFGNNGCAFANKLKGFDVEVLAYDKYKIGFETDWVKEVQLREIFERADIVSFHIPQNKETLFMGRESFFNAFKQPIYVLNMSRGKIVSTNDLLRAIQKGKVLGACLDVLEFESSSFENISGLSDSFKELLNAEKVIFSPHVAGWTKESYWKLSNVLADKIIAWKDSQ